VPSVLTTCIRAETCREYRGYIIKYFVNCCGKEGIIYSLVFYYYYYILTVSEVQSTYVGVGSDLTVGTY
jgi:hypothetical protein